MFHGGVTCGIKSAHLSLLEMGHYGHKETLGRKKAPSIEGALEIKQFEKNTTLAVAFVYWFFKYRQEWVDT